METSAATSVPQVERRTHVRVPVVLLVRLRRFGQTQWRMVTCTEISVAGLRIDCEEMLVVGEIVELQFVGADDNISARSRVTFRQMQHYGLCYLDSAPPLPPGAPTPES